MNKTLKDYKDTVRLLRSHINLFHSGLRESYLDVAVHLRKLLCDYNRGEDISLLPRVFREITLHRFHRTVVFEKKPSLYEGFINPLPGRLRSQSDGTKTFELTFHSADERVPVNEWVAQPFLSREITVRKFIKSVADKLAAHSDRDYDDTLKLTKSILYVDEESHILMIVAIGEYLLKFMETEQLEINAELLEP